MSLIRGAVLIASLTLASVTPAEAQRTIGAKGGLSIARFTGSSLDRVEYAQGLTGGVFLTTRMADDLSFQAEATYVRKGAAISFTHGSAQRAGTLRLDYLEVPSSCAWTGRRSDWRHFISLADLRWPSACSAHSMTVIR